MENIAITVKTFYEGDIRRFNLPTRTFARLREVLKEVYNELPSEFVVKYADEEDEFVTIGSDVELAEAIKVANAQGTKALKLYVSGNNKSGSIVDLKMPASEPSTPKVATPAPAVPAANPTAAAAAAAPTAAEQAAPAAAAAAPKVEAKTENKKPSCAELKQLLLEFVQDAKVQAALPAALQAVLNAAPADQPLSAKALVEALLKSSSDISNHPSVQAIRPLLDECVLPCLQAKLDRVRPEHVQMAKMWAPMLLTALPGLLQALPALLAGFQGEFFDCQQGAAAGAGCEQSQAQPDQDVLRMLPMLLAMAAGGAGAGAGAGAGGAAFPFPPPPPPHGGAPFPFPFPGFGGPFPGPHGAHHGGPRHGHGHPFFGRGMREFMREEARGAPAAAAAPAESASAPGLGLSDKADRKGDTKTTSAPVADVHQGITCDGCRASPITGIRYKCATCSDYDLCESCEAKNVHPAHPLIKIRKEKAPEESSDVHTNVKCDGCGVVPIKGIRYKCTTCPNYDLCESCEGKNVHPVHPLIKMRVKMPEQQSGFGHGPHGGRFGFGGHHGGHGPFGRGRMLHRLFGGMGGRRGDSPCWRRRDGEAAGSAAGAPVGNERPTAEFVKDLTIPDRSETAPSATLVKTWSVKNNGSVAWPEGGKLIFVRGDREISAQEEFTIPAAKPGETVEINAVIVTPAKKGRYTAFFRLAEKDRVYMFGPRLWVDLFVGEAPATAEGKVDKKQEAPAVAAVAAAPATPKPAPSAPVAPAPVAAAAPATPKSVAAAPAAAQPKPAVPSKWAIQLELLASMGFGNTELNTYLLDRNQGNVQKVAEFLLERMR